MLITVQENDFSNSIGIAVYVLILSDEPSLSFLRRAHMFLVFFCFVAALFLFQLLSSFLVGLNAVAD